MPYYQFIFSDPKDDRSCQGILYVRKAAHDRALCSAKTKVAPDRYPSNVTLLLFGFDL